MATLTPHRPHPGTGTSGAVPTDRFALAAFLLAIASFVVLPLLPAVAALVVGARANSRLNDVDDAVRGRGLLRAAWVIAVLNVVVMAAVVAVVQSTSSTLRSTGERIVAVRSLHAGQCFDGNPHGNVLTVTVVPCSHPHDHEEFARYDDSTPADAPWPGEETETVRAYAGCMVRFPAFVGRAYEGSSFTLYRLRPSERTWTDGDRLVQCAVSARDGSRLTGPARGSGR